MTVHTVNVGEHRIRRRRSRRDRGLLGRGGWCGVVRGRKEVWEFYREEIKQGKDANRENEGTENVGACGANRIGKEQNPKKVIDDN